MRALCQQASIFLAVFLVSVHNAPSAEPAPQQVAPGVWLLRYGTPEKHTPIAFRTKQPRTDAMKSLPSANVPFDASQIVFGVSGRGCSLEVPLDANEQLYGLGMNLKTFQQRGCKRTVRVSDDQTTDIGDSHAPVPFYVSTKGYGVFVDTAQYASFYFGNLAPLQNAPTKKPEATQKNATSTEELYRARDVNSKFVGVDVPSARGVDVYLIAGPTMQNAVQRYNLFSGGGCLPAMWGLGVWYRASTELGEKEVLNFLREFRERHVPCDVFGLEPGWHTHAYSCTFAWSDKYPSPDALIRESQTLGYKLNLWEHAFTHPSSPLYRPLLPYSGNYAVWEGLVPDFATREARTIFADYHDKNLVARGISGFKLDECDHQPVRSTPWSFPEQTAFPSGLDGEQMHQLIGQLYQQTLVSIFDKRNQRTFSLVRASGALAAPLPFGVYSDAYDHRDYVRAIATCGFGGILWCPEVRDMGSLEELYRRVETSIFSPLMQMDCWYLKNPMWKQIEKDANNRGQFMPGWEKTETACRKLFELRMALMPYLYAAYAEYHDRGVPPTRAIVMDYPDDPAVRGIDDQYMFGPSLMVAPLFTGQAKRKVYLPKGDWYDFWTHEKHAGGRTIEVEKPHEQIPVFVKGNTLLPLAKPVEYVASDTQFEITVHVFGEQPAPFVLYEDDGVSLDFEKGKQNRIELRYSGNRGTESKTGEYVGPARYKVARWAQVQK